VTAAPATYAEWAAVLDAFLAGDEEAVGRMEAGRFEWTPVAAERLTRRVHEAFFVRLRLAQEGLQRNLDHARGNEARMAQALVGARAMLAPLARVAQVAAFPEPLRAHLAGELDRLASGMQASLEASARADRAGGERMLALVRTHAIRVPWPPSPMPVPAAPPASCATPAGAPWPPGARRPIILG